MIYIMNIWIASKRFYKEINPQKKNFVAHQMEQIYQMKTVNMLKFMENI